MQDKGLRKTDLRKTLVSYIGTVAGLKGHMAAQLNPGKVVSLEAYRIERQKKTARRRPHPSIA